jgi:hypothetical protein
MDSPAFLVVVAPISNIFFANIRPVHSPHSAFLILFPFSLEEIAGRIVVHLTVALFHIIAEAALKDAATLKHYLTLSMLLSLQPLALINCLINAVLSIAMTQSVFDLAFVGAAIWPSVSSLPSDAIIGELTLVDNAIGPGEGALAIKKSVVEVTLISIAVLKSNFSRSI